ncbi:MAG: hypothetical protein DYG89_34630 [Caldilinea sp. CFX5]|nr:hypothetical protein [Caldilinea sp. CFX5]
MKAKQVTRRTIAILLINSILLFLATPLFAGGWAVVTVDELPQSLHAGETKTLGFTIRQHGRHPVNVEDVYVRAIDPTSDAALTFPARQEGDAGHYAVDILLPTAGLWEWEIQPGWFPPVTMAPMPVLAQTTMVHATGTATTALAGWLPWFFTALGAMLLSSAALSPRFASRRLRLITGGVGLLVVVGGLGWAALVMRLPTTLAAQPVATDDYGRALFMAKGCNSCHLHEQARNAWTTEMGPNLTHYQNTVEYLHAWLKDPQAIKPNTEMPNLGLKPNEIDALAVFLSPSKP